MKHKIESETYIAIMDNLPNYEKIYFKVGRTTNRVERFRQLRNANPFIKTCLVMPFDCELYLKHYLKDLKIVNEWHFFESKDIRDLSTYLKPLIVNYKKNQQ